MKQLYIIRGVSGSGKSTFATHLYHMYSNTDNWATLCEADMYFYDEQGNYNFDANKLYQAHMWCQRRVEEAMKADEVVIVSNTSTKEPELKPYLTLAEKYGYNVTSLIVENRHGNKDKHNVPEETLQRQEHNLRNSIKLR